jgi:hypothetical protein
MLTAGVIGFCIGLLVPSLYRARSPVPVLPAAVPRPLAAA